MNRSQFTELVRNPELLDTRTLPVLEQLKGEFPFCQTIEVLCLINLKKENDHRYDSQLRLAAAYASDRSKLMDWMMKTVPVKPSRIKQEQKEYRQVSKQELQPADIQKAIALQDQDEEKIKAHLDELEAMIRSNLADIEEKRARLRELIGEKQSILREAEVDPEVMIPEERKETRPLPKDDLLEEFLRQHKSEAVQQPGFFNPVETAKKSVEDKEDIVSETLAKVLASQGNILKAIKIYQQLSLKYPEKSRNFAAQIEKLNERLTNKG